MQQNPTPESPTQVPRALRIPIHSAYTFGTKNKLPAVLLVVPSLVVLDRWRPPFGIAIVLEVALLTVLSLVLRSYWLLEVVEDATPPAEAGEVGVEGRGGGCIRKRAGIRCREGLVVCFRIGHVIRCPVWSRAGPAGSPALSGETGAAQSGSRPVSVCLVAHHLAVDTGGDAGAGQLVLPDADPGCGTKSWQQRAHAAQASGGHQ